MTIIMGDFNIDVTNRWVEFDKLDELCINEFDYFSYVLHQNA